MIVGHRGTGKTSVLKRWKIYSPELSFVDLDEEIEKAEGLSIQKIFSEKGEAYFREVEQRIWKEMKATQIISVGGGFNLELISSAWKVLWVRRDSDSPDRIFLDRPVLSDYRQRFEDRERKFLRKADRIYTMPEGLSAPDDQEKQILLNDFQDVGGAVTLPKMIYPGSLIEVRDDLEYREYKTSDLLFSVRAGSQIPKNVKVDWDIKRQIPSGLKPYIISTHEKSLESLFYFENTETILKYCPEVNSWADLKKGMDWQKKNPEKNVFLPRSNNGRWSWFRLWMKGRQNLNFWREGTGSATDQPTLWEWLGHPIKAEKFAAVLGSPINHSFSPTYHKSFFKPLNIPFYKIRIEDNEWGQAMPILQEMGLLAAAVTSPLKNKAGQWVNTKAINTLWKEKTGNWSGINTDKTGAEALLEEFKDKRCVVWGGGGVLEVIKEVLPEASFYSSQTAEAREGSKTMIYPDVLIWADPNNSAAKIPADWTPSVVVDLSYHDRSPARAYALKHKIQYVSGLKMFVTQADEQQKYWAKIFV